MSIDKAATIVAALAAPLLALAVDQHWLSALTATDLGAIVAAFIGALHVNNDAARAALRAQDSAASAARSGDPGAGVAPSASDL